MRFNLVVHDPDALFSMIDQQRRDQAVIEADDAARRQRATQRDARSVAAAATKLQDNDAGKHDGSKRAKTAGVKAERNYRYENCECFVCGKQGHKQWDCPQASRGRRRKAFMARATARPPSSSNSSSPQAVPLRIPGAKLPGRPLRLPPYGWSWWIQDRFKSGGYGNRTCCACGVYEEG